MDGAAVAAAHRDDDVGGAHDLVGQRLGELEGHLDPELGDRLDDGVVDDRGGIRAGGERVDAAFGDVTGERGGHLRARGVLGADEQHERRGLGDQAVGLRGGLQALAREALDQDREVGGDRDRDQPLERVRDDGLDGLAREHAVVLLDQPRGDRAQPPLQRLAHQWCRGILTRPRARRTSSCCRHSRVRR